MWKGVNRCRSMVLVFGVGEEGRLDSEFWLVLCSLLSLWPRMGHSILLLVTLCTNDTKLLFTSCLYSKELKYPLCKWWLAQFSDPGRSWKSFLGWNALLLSQLLPQTHPAPPNTETPSAETHKFLRSFVPETTLDSCNSLCHFDLLSPIWRWSGKGIPGIPAVLA